MRLAINGGKKIRTKLFPAQKTIDYKEKQAVEKFLEKQNILSFFRGNFGPNFYGGEQIQSFESNFAKQFNNKLPAIAVNSCTSALQIACLAIGLKPGDEVIVDPYTMICSATAPMVAGATPIFCDIEDKFYTIDPDKVESLITEKTKAIIFVDIFGHIQYNIEKLQSIAKKYNLYLIEDAAQALGASQNYKYAGTFGDIGCFSFTQGKHLTAGEGGCILTENEELWEKCSLLRNHSDSVINDMKPDLQSKLESFKLPGFNMRMTELQAVILNVQLTKLEDYIRYRTKNAMALKSYLKDFEFLDFPVSECNHAYYVFSFQYNKEKLNGIHRDRFVEAVKAELSPEEERIDRGVAMGGGYIKPLYRFPIFEGKFIYANYPVVENMWKEKLIIMMQHSLNLDVCDVKDIVDAFQKVYDNRDEL